MAKSKSKKPATTKKAVAKKVVSKALKKVASKAVKKVAKKATAKTVKKTVKKVAKKAAPKLVKKPVKKVTQSIVPKPVRIERNDAGFLLAKKVVEAILEKKGDSIICLDLRKLENAVADYYIICEATSNIQVEAIADSVEDLVKKDLGQRPFRSEGWENALWILIDYIDVVVHVFERETRHFYNLESLWADGEIVKIDN